MKHIIIRGPLGVGKSTIARELSEKLNYEYVSLDKLIDSNNLIPPGVDGVPIESFRQANKFIQRIAKDTKKYLVVEGCFYYQDQIDDLIAKLDGEVIIFSLNCSLEECIRRDSRRKKAYGEDATSFVYMMTNRVRAGFDIDTTKLSVEETLAAIMTKLKL